MTTPDEVARQARSIRPKHATATPVFETGTAEPQNWTYVAATLTSILTLLYFLFRSGLLGGRSHDE